MTDRGKNAEKQTQKSKEKKEPSYWERVIHGKGTVAEPWPTAKELWEDMEEEVKEVQSILNPKKKDDH